METRLFSKSKLKNLIVPLIFEQLLVVMVGTADTLMISSVGEAAVSGVSLVDNLNTLVITLLTGLSTGGAVLCAHFAGRKKDQDANEVLKHMLLIVLVISLCFMVIFLWGGRNLLELMFGQAGEDVLADASVYFTIVTLSFPFLGIYGCCSAAYRGIGNTRMPMLVSLMMNVINIAGNAVLLYGFHWGVEGAAVPTLLSRAAGMAVMVAMLNGKRSQIRLDRFKLSWNFGIVKKILSVGVPGSLELSIFQIGKIMVLGFMAQLGTTAVTANAIGNTLNNIQALPEDAIGLALITIVGQCIGADEREQAVYYTRKLVKAAYCAMWGINLVIFLGAGEIGGLFALTPKTAETAGNVIRFNCIFAMTVWPLAFALPNALKGAMDVKFPLGVSLFSMWVFRVGCSFLAVTFLDGDIYTLYFCFAMDWVFRAVMFTRRFRGRKWLKQ